MRIVTYRTSIKNNTVLLEESGGEFVVSNDLEKLFSFLLEPYENTIRACWELDTTVSLFFRLMEEKACEKLRETHKCYLPPFSIFYVPDKVFSINHIPTKLKANLYELQQYFPELPEPQNTEELVMLGELLLQELGKMGLKPTTKLTSPIAIYDECIMSKMDLPQVKDMPVEAAEMAMRCSGRLWIESHQIGHYDIIHDYDLVSAFPSITKELVDTRLCEWKQSDKYQKKAVYGYTKCEVTIYDWVVVSPIIAEVEDGLISPVGTWETFLTKEELDFIDRHKIGNYKIQDGWWAISKKKGELRKPLYAPMTKLLSYKQRSELQGLLAKRMSTGVYGKFGEERKEEFGEHFNPCYFAEISTQTRLRVAEFLYAHGIGPRVSGKYDTLVHIGVDGVLLTEPVENGSSRWKLAYKGEALVVSSGLVYTERTKPKGLRLNDIQEMIARHPRRGYYAKGVVRRLTLGDSLAQHRLRDIGKEIEFSSSISLIEQEHDRKFSKLPKTGEALLGNKYKSVPRRMEGDECQKSSRGLSEQQQKPQE